MPCGSPEFPNQKLRQIGEGVPSYDRTNKQTRKQRLHLYIFIYIYIYIDCRCINATKYTQCNDGNDRLTLVPLKPLSDL